MRFPNVVTSRQVGHRAGHPQHAVIAAPRQAELPRRRLREGEGASREGGVFAQRLPREVAVAHTLAREHPLTGGGDALTDGRGGFRLGGAGEFVYGQAGDFDHQVYAVEQRSTQPRRVPGALDGRAGAGLFRVTEVSAGTRVHSGQQLKPGRILHRRAGAADGDAPVLQRLP